MALTNHEIYRRKCHIFARFRFSCTEFDGHLKSQASRHPSPAVFTQNVSNNEIFQKILTKAGNAKGRSDILIDKAILILLCRSSDCAPLSTNTDRLIWAA